MKKNKIFITNYKEMKALEEVIKEQESAMLGYSPIPLLTEEDRYWMDVKFATKTCRHTTIR